MIRTLSRSCTRDAFNTRSLLRSRDFRLLLNCHKSALINRSLSSIAPETPRPVYRETLLIYHAGVGRIVFIGCLKLTTLFLFLYAYGIVAPAYYYAPNESNWIVPVAIVAGAIPLVFVAYTSNPFVNYIHVRLPLYARRSKVQLMQWSKNIAPDTEIGITTMTFYGRQRVTRMLFKDLRPTEARFGVVNIEKVEKNPPLNQRRNWWMGRKPSLFHVGEGKSKLREPTILEQFRKQIRKSGESNQYIK